MTNWKCAGVMPLAMLFAAPCVGWGDSISFNTYAVMDWGPSFHTSASAASTNVGFPFITSAVDFGFPFFAQFYAGADATVNGWVGVAAQVNSWESGPNV